MQSAVTRAAARLSVQAVRRVPEVQPGQEDLPDQEVPRLRLGLLGLPDLERLGHPLVRGNRAARVVLQSNRQVPDRREKQPVSQYAYTYELRRARKVVRGLKHELTEAERFEIADHVVGQLKDYGDPWGLSEDAKSGPAPTT